MSTPAEALDLVRHIVARRERALFAARLRALPGKDRTILTTEAIDDVCAELIAVIAVLEVKPPCQHLFKSRAPVSRGVFEVTCLECGSKRGEIEL